VLDWLAVSVFGMLGGIGELFARYRTAPLRAVISWPAFFYLAVYVVCALVALALIRTFEVTFWLNPQESAIELRITQVLVATFGSMLFLHSSLLSVRIGDEEVGIGPSTVLLTILRAVDSHVDRATARARAQEVSRIMEGVYYNQALTLLPAYSFALAQDVSPEDQKVFSEQVLRLDTLSGDPRNKALALGLLIANFVGVNILKHAVYSLRASLTQPGLEEFTPERRVKLAGRFGELTTEERARFTEEALKSKRETLGPDQILKLVEKIKAREAKSAGEHKKDNGAR
jgi:hypothetical protein